MSECTECLGQGGFWTEWSDAGEALAASGDIRVLARPDDPDGTVYIECPACSKRAGEDVETHLA